MIAVDASAVIAIVKEEPDHERYGDLIASDRTVMAAPTLLETKMVLSRLLDDADADRLLDGLVLGGLNVIDFTPSMADAAVDAFRRFGKGQGHPAQLNFGDCMSYAVAKVRGVPLLYKGSDFAQTDIVSALS